MKKQEKAVDNIDKQINEEERTWVEELYPYRTVAAIRKPVEDVQKICRICSVGLFLILLIRYACSIAENWLDGHAFALDCGMLLLIVAHFIASRVYERKKRQNKEAKNTVGTILKWSKFVLRTIVVGCGVYDVFFSQAAPLEVFTATLAFVGILVQITVEITVIVIKKYCEMLEIAFKLDLQVMQKSRVGSRVVKTVDALSNPQATLLDLLDKPLASWASKVSNDVDAVEIEEDPPRVKKIKEMLHARANQIEQDYLKKNRQKKLEKKRKKEEQKQARINDARDRLKKHVITILKGENQ